MHVFTARGYFHFLDGHILKLMRTLSSRKRFLGVKILHLDYFIVNKYNIVKKYLSIKKE